MQTPENIISCVRIKPLPNNEEEISCIKFEEKSVLLLKTKEKYNFGKFFIPNKINHKKRESF